MSKKHTHIYNEPPPRPLTQEEYDELYPDMDIDMIGPVLEPDEEGRVDIEKQDKEYLEEEYSPPPSPPKTFANEEPPNIDEPDITSTMDFPEEGEADECETFRMLFIHNLWDSEYDNRRMKYLFFHPFEFVHCLTVYAEQEAVSILDIAKTIFKKILGQALLIGVIGIVVLYVIYTALEHKVENVDWSSIRQQLPDVNKEDVKEVLENMDLPENVDVTVL